MLYTKFSTSKHGNDLDISLSEQFDTTRYGSCMIAAEILTNKLLSQGYTDFKVVEGYITFPGVEWEAEHTWIELVDGVKIDPTKEQWDLGEPIYLRRKQKRYTPEEYLDLCRKYPEDINKYLKKKNTLQKLVIVSKELKKLKLFKLSDRVCNVFKKLAESYTKKDINDPEVQEQILDFIELGYLTYIQDFPQIKNHPQFRKSLLKALKEKQTNIEEIKKYCPDVVEAQWFWEAILDLLKNITLDLDLFSFPDSVKQNSSFIETFFLKALNVRFDVIRFFPEFRSDPRVLAIALQFINKGKISFVFYYMPELIDYPQFLQIALDHIRQGGFEILEIVPEIKDKPQFTEAILEGIRNGIASAFEILFEYVPEIKKHPQFKDVVVEKISKGDTHIFNYLPIEYVQDHPQFKNAIIKSIRSGKPFILHYIPELKKDSEIQEAILERIRKGDAFILKLIPEIKEHLQFEEAVLESIRNGKPSILEEALEIKNHPEFEEAALDCLRNGEFFIFKWVPELKDNPQIEEIALERVYKNDYEIFKYIEPSSKLIRKLDEIFPLIEKDKELLEKKQFTGGKKYKFPHSVERLNKKRVGYWQELAGMYGKQSWQSNIYANSRLVEELGIPLEIFNRLDPHKQSIRKNRPYLGWIGGAMDDENLYVTESQSDLMQNLYLLQDPEKHLRQTEEKLQRAEEEGDEVKIRAYEKLLQDIRVDYYKYNKDWEKYKNILDNNFGGWRTIFMNEAFARARDLGLKNVYVATAKNYAYHKPLKRYSAIQMSLEDQAKKYQGAHLSEDGMWIIVSVQSNSDRIAKNIIRRLTKVSDDLNKLGLLKQANRVNSVLRKLASKNYVIETKKEENSVFYEIKETLDNPTDEELQKFIDDNIYQWGFSWFNKLTPQEQRDYAKTEYKKSRQPEQVFFSISFLDEFFRDYYDKLASIENIKNRALDEDRKLILMKNLDQQRRDIHNKAANFVIDYAERMSRGRIKLSIEDARRLVESSFPYWFSNSSSISYHEALNPAEVELCYYFSKDVKNKIKKELGIDVVIYGVVAGFHENNPMTSVRIEFTGGDKKDIIDDFIKKMAKEYDTQNKLDKKFKN